MTCPYHDPDFLISIVDETLNRFEPERQGMTDDHEEIRQREAAAVQYATVRALVCRHCRLTAEPACKVEADFLPPAVP